MADIRIRAAHTMDHPLGCAQWNGAFFYKSCAEGEESVCAFMEDFGRNKAIFSEILGTYHIVLRFAKETVFFSDNAGVCRFFVRQDADLAADRFLDLLDLCGDFCPDPRSAEEFLSLGYVYGGRTLDSRIVRSDPGLFYRVRDGKIATESKHLPDLSEKEACLGLTACMDRMANALKERKIACVITGGVDSRMVLAHLIRLGVDFDLVVSGKEDMADVRIAHQIADVLHKTLHVIDGSVETEADFEKAFVFADGQRDLAARYRLTRMWMTLEEMGYQVCFGGAAGEMYKNSFLNQDFPFYYGKPNYGRFIKMKVLTGRIPQAISGSGLPGQLDAAIAIIGPERAKRRGYFRLGAKILMDRYTGANNLTGSLGGIAPLAEPRVQMEAFHTNPYRLEMHAFARKHVSRCAPSLVSIKTDRGLSCKSGMPAILRDACQNYIRLAGYALRRLRGKALKTESATVSPLVEAHMQQALEACIRQGFFREGTVLSQLKPALRENMLTLGTLLIRYHA